MLPIIQGFVQLEQCVIGTDCFTLSLISRRSRFRAGTRYYSFRINSDNNELYRKSVDKSIQNLKQFKVLMTNSNEA